MTQPCSYCSQAIATEAGGPWLTHQKHLQHTQTSRERPQHLQAAGKEQMRRKVPAITPNLTAPGGLLKSLEGLELSCGTHRAPALTIPHPGENQPQNSDVFQQYKPQIPHGPSQDQERPGPIRGKGKVQANRGPFPTRHPGAGDVEPVSHAALQASPLAYQAPS